jgi:hypothetical protein
MGLEVATYIHQLNPANPVGAVDPKSQGDDHFRLIKSTLQATFPNITDAVTVTHTQLNTVGASGVSGFAVPTVKVKSTGAAGAGALTTALRSDAQLLIDLADGYAWTGQHSWTVQLRVLDGAVGAPSFAFSSETNTGIYRSAAGTIGLAIAGALRYTFSATGLDTERVRAVDGSTALPAFTFASDTNTGIFRGGADDFAFSAGGTFVAGIQLDGSARPKMYFADGVSAAPVITFSSDTDTGLFRPGANEMRFMAGGTYALGLQLIGATTVAYFGDGTAAQPGITFGAIDCGFYRVGANAIGFSEGGSGFRIGYRNIPQNSQSANYGCVLTDAGKHIYHPNGGGAGDTFTIPANASVAYDIGTVLTFINRDSNAISIAITSDTLQLAGTGATGTRTLAAFGIATAIKITSTEWLISGTGLT